MGRQTQMEEAMRWRTNLRGWSARVSRRRHRRKRKGKTRRSMRRKMTMRESSEARDWSLTIVEEVS
jgi:hypothetical protein